MIQPQECALDIGEEHQRHGNHFQDMYQAVIGLERKIDLLTGEVRPRHSLSLPSDEERQVVKAWLARFRALPLDQQQRTPALLNGLGKLQLAAGNFHEAFQVFEEVAAFVTVPAARAEAHYNAHRAALERRDWSGALAALRQAVLIDPQRWTPFPQLQYQMQRILGANGLSVTFLCRDRSLNEPVIVKTLVPDSLDRPLQEVFAEAEALGRLEHRAILRVRSCGYAFPTQESQPFLVLDYFDGWTLEEHVRRYGPLTPEELLEVARTAAQGLHAVHARNILHRALTPANFLVRRREEKGSPPVWEARLTDFGLAVRPSEVLATRRNPSLLFRSNLGDSLADALAYSAPELLGWLEGVSPGPHSDVYGFGKTCYYALLRTPEPDDEEKESLSHSWRKLLSVCTARSVAKRPPDFAEVLKRLAHRPAESYADFTMALPTVERPRSPARTLAPTGDQTANGSVPRKRSWWHLFTWKGKSEIRPDGMSDPEPDAKPSPLLANSIGLEVVLIPAGRFFMGSPRTEMGRSEDEEQHEVEISKPFYLGAYPVTQEEYGRVMGKSPSWFSPKSGGRDKVGKWDTQKFPVESVSWYDAVDFCLRLSALPEEKKAGRKYRLPTEAEWEYACRGGSSSDMPFYFGRSLSSHQANFNGHYPYGLAPKGDFLDRTTTVGTYEANAFGLHDMHGNVWEWCADWYDADYYKRSPKRDPQGPEDGNRRAVRGGSWYYNGSSCRAAQRFGIEPSFRGDGIGFRVVCVMHRLN
jgi:formylglycine-generating enzyme required for sulfatase activity